MIVDLPNLKATRALAARVGRELANRDLILLTGELGAGKTTFVGYLASCLGVEEGWVSSPSFTLIQRYPPGKSGVGLVHVDLYRLGSAAELWDLGLEDVLASEDLVAVEWPEVGEALWAASGRRRWTLTFTVTGEGKHRVAVQVPPGSSRGR